MPVPGSVALDTNIAVLFLSGDGIIRRRVAELESIIVSTVVLGELFYGASQSARVEENLRRVETFASNVEVIEVTIETARHFGLMKTLLRRKGTPIPNNDVWIAALARQFDATIATRDQHFDCVEGIKIARW